MLSATTGRTVASRQRLGLADISKSAKELLSDIRTILLHSFVAVLALVIDVALKFAFGLMARFGLLDKNGLALAAGVLTWFGIVVAVLFSVTVCAVLVQRVWRSLRERSEQ